MSKFTKCIHCLSALWMEMECNSRDGGSDWEGIDGLFDF